MASLPLIGFGFGHWDRALRMQASAWDILGVMLAWVLLHFGTMWFNATLDRDDGDVLYGRSLPVPAITRSAALAALTACVACALAANRGVVYWPRGAFAPTPVRAIEAVPGEDSWLCGWRVIP